MISTFPTTIAERMEQFCQRFEVEPVKLRYTRRASDSVRATDELLSWHDEHGASLDWICCGDPRPMMVAYRNNHLQTRSMVRALVKLDAAELRGIEFVVRAVVEGHVSADDAFPMLFDVLKERRAKLIGGAA